MRTVTRQFHWTSILLGQFNPANNPYKSYHISTPLNKPPTAPSLMIANFRFNFPWRKRNNPLSISPKNRVLGNLTPIEKFESAYEKAVHLRARHWSSGYRSAHLKAPKIPSLSARRSLVTDRQMSAEFPFSTSEAVSRADSCYVALERHLICY